MGWLFGWDAKKGLVSELTTKSADDMVACLAKSTVGNHLWVVWESTDGSRNIALYLLAKDRLDGWGYKDMDEAMHPFYYDCPLRFLDMVTPVCPEWREGVVKYHEEKAKAKEHRALIKEGTRVRVNNTAGIYAGKEVTVTKILPRKRACVLVAELGIRFYPENLEVV